MNKEGHPETLVAAHPGNANALKSGVFSEGARMQRVHEIEGEIAARDAPEVMAEVLRREVAALAALSEAMDESLATDGIRGRTGDPKNLVTLRFRLNDRLRRSLDAYAAATARVEASAEENAVPAADGAPPRDTLIETIARFHMRDSIKQIRPVELDPEQFLSAFIATTDLGVPDSVRFDARKMLTKLTKARRPTCTCFATVRARDEIEFREWVDALRDTPGFEPSRTDGRLAVYVRAMARGDRSELPAFSDEMEQALKAVVRRGVARALEQDKPNEPQRHTQERDSATRPFWKAALSASDKVSPKTRFRALAALHELGVLPKCTCAAKKGPVRREMRIDEFHSYVIRSVAERHFRASVQTARFPETFIAVRDAIDAAVLETQAEAERSAA